MDRMMRQGLAGLAVPWNVFVAAFLYYIVLTLVVIAGYDVSWPTMLAAYLIWPAAYVAAILFRAAQSAAARLQRGAGGFAAPQAISPH